LFDIAIPEMFGVKSLSMLDYGIAEGRSTSNGQDVCDSRFKILQFWTIADRNEPVKCVSALLVVTH
jgi:hypothetical protein